MVQRKTSLSCVNGSFFPCPFLGLGRFLMAIGISEKQSFSCVKRIPTLGTSINVDVWICARFITYYYMNFALFFIIDALAPSQEEEFFEGGKNQFLIIWLLHGVADSCRDKYSGRSIVIGARNLRVCCLIKKIFEFFRGLWVSRIISMIFHWVSTYYNVQCLKLMQKVSFYNIVSKASVKVSEFFAPKINSRICKYYNVYFRWFFQHCWTLERNQRKEEKVWNIDICIHF